MAYPNITDDDFYKKITDKYHKYKISNRKKTMEQICFPKQFELQPSQQFLPKFINPKTPYKNILVFHKIGSGKTCTAIRIGETWKHHRKIVVVVPASLIGNFRTELRSLCAGNEYLTNRERELLQKYHPSSDEYKDIIEISDKRIDKYYEIYSYNKFVEYAQDDDMKLRNSVLIIDEIQNMVSETGTFYKTLYDVITDAPRNLVTVLLSATPMFDKPVEIALTMNLLHLPVELPIGVDFEKTFISVRKNKSTGKFYYSAKNLDIFKERIRGRVSYYLGADPVSFPKALIRYVKCEMSDFQYRSYLTVMREEERTHKEFVKMKKFRAFRVGQILDLPNNFFMGSRLISNVAFPNRGIGEKGFESFKGKVLNIDNLSEFSIKFFKILTKVNKASGPVYIYSEFKEYGGLYALSKVFEHNGYVDYSQYGEGRRRFAFFTGDESKEYKDEIKSVYNQKENTNGSKLKVLFISKAGKEGLSLYRTQQAHILEPYFNQSRLDQVFGRGMRYCSHKDLPEEKRLVKIYIYIATHPEEEESIDEYIMKMSMQKNRIVKEFEMAMKEVAVDCQLFRNANNREGDDINCNK